MATLLGALFGGLKSTAANSDPKAMAAAYKFALDGISYQVLKKAVSDVLRGQAAGLSATFLPTSAELTEYCRKIADATSQAISAYERIASAAEVQRKETVSPERIEELKTNVLKKIGDAA